MVSYQWLKSLWLSLENVSLGKYFLEVQVPCCLSVFVWLGFLPFFFLFSFSFLPKKRVRWFMWMNRISVRRVLFQNGLYISWLKTFLAHFHDSDGFVSSTRATWSGELESYVMSVVAARRDSLHHILILRLPLEFLG